VSFLSSRLKPEINISKNKKNTFPGPYGILRVVARLTRSERFLLLFLALVFLVSTFALLANINNNFLDKVPVEGGKISEGIVGVPRFINPVLAVSDPDHDLTELVFDGLLKPAGDGSYVGDLAKGYAFSPDKKTVTVELKDNLTWHDNTPLTVEDVIFTISRIKDPETRSPNKASWDGVSVEKTGDLTVSFTLANPYAPFVENLTVGIIPKHIWEKIAPSEMIYSTENLNAVGSGPYAISEIGETGSGIPEYINLRSWKKYHDGKPLIPKIKISFYSNEESLVSAFIKGNIESLSGVSPKTGKLLESQGFKTLEFPMPRVFGVFFNQKNSPVLARKEVREALEASVDKAGLIQSILMGAGTSLAGPLPPPFAYKNTQSKTSAEEILEAAGWKKNADGIWEIKIKKETLKLAFSLSTSDSMELKSVADKLKESWEQAGAKVEIKVFDTSDLNQDIIRNRKYEGLLFGEIIGRYPDPFAFWHTSQRIDPGLNISMYSSSQVDKITTDLRQTIDTTERRELYRKLGEGLAKDMPAIFLYSPHYLYIPGPKVSNITLGNLSGSSDRFINIHKWYIYDEPIWQFLN